MLIQRDIIEDTQGGDDIPTIDCTYALENACERANYMKTLRANAPHSIFAKGPSGLLCTGCVFSCDSMHVDSA